MLKVLQFEAVQYLNPHSQIFLAGASTLEEFVFLKIKLEQMNSVSSCIFSECVNCIYIYLN